ncbi:very short patch repair endonuclease [Mucilaginibacter sp. NFX135]|uniref:very short patch repair endonuclease n=1 Tax=Mucilaginibacter sp. NFX135 TaxID=3402687 RepID=UPI003AFA26B2
MTDIWSKEKRSAVMSKIRSKNTKPEIQLRSYLHSQGLRFRINRKDLPGKPDIVLPKYKTVIFVHGCFWHYHHCREGKIPKTNTIFWEDKLLKNVKRDAINQERLTADGWKVLVVWECELEGKAKSQEFLGELLNKVICT